jgi:hypothetical protein
VVRCSADDGHGALWFHVLHFVRCPSDWGRLVRANYYAVKEEVRHYPAAFANIFVNPLRLSVFRKLGDHLVTEVLGDGHLIIKGKPSTYIPRVPISCL